MMIDSSQWELRQSSASEVFQRLLDPMSSGPASVFEIASGDGVFGAATLTLLLPEKQRQVVDELPSYELRQFNETADANGWNPSVGGYLSASLSVEATPAAADGGAARVAIIRILGASGELLALYYDEGTLYFERTGTVERTAERADLLSNDGRPTDIGLGIRFDCFVRVTLEGVSVSVIHDGTSYSAQRDVDRAWFGQPLHFNAGISLASKELVGTAKVKFYLLTVPKRNSSDRSSGVAKKRRLHLGVPGTRQ